MTEPVEQSSTGNTNDHPQGPDEVLIENPEVPDYRLNRRYGLRPNLKPHNIQVSFTNRDIKPYRHTLIFLI